jgi:hypothetical protein
LYRIKISPEVSQDNRQLRRQIFEKITDEIIKRISLTGPKIITIIIIIIIIIPARLITIEEVLLTSKITAI